MGGGELAYGLYTLEIHKEITYLCEINADMVLVGNKQNLWLSQNVILTQRKAGSRGKTGDGALDLLSLLTQMTPYQSLPNIL